MLCITQLKQEITDQDRQVLYNNSNKFPQTTAGMKCFSLSLGYFLKPATFSTIKRTVTLELCRQGILSYSPAQTMRKEPSPRIIALTYVFRYSSLTPLSFSRRSVLITLIGDFSVNCTPSVRKQNTAPAHQKVFTSAHGGSIEQAL